MLKQLIQATVAASLVATPMIATAAEAQARAVTTVERPNGTTVRTVQKANGATVRTVTPATRYAAPRVTYRKWARGQRFDRRYAQNYRVIDYRQYRTQRLWAPPRGYQWVRSGNDAVLVAAATGLIAAVLANSIR